MNLQQLEQGLGGLYPPLRTRSGQSITTHVVEGTATSEGLAVTVKTLFPPSSRGRSTLVVTNSDGELRVRPTEAVDLVEAQRFAERLRERWSSDEPDEPPLAPLRIVKDDEGRNGFHVGRVREAAKQTASHTVPATPVARRETHGKGDS